MMTEDGLRNTLSFSFKCSLFQASDIDVLRSELDWLMRERFIFKYFSLEPILVVVATTGMERRRREILSLWGTRRVRKRKKRNTLLSDRVHSFVDFISSSVDALNDLEIGRGCGRCGRCGRCGGSRRSSIRGFCGTEGRCWTLGRVFFIWSGGAVSIAHIQLLSHFYAQ